MGKKAAGAAMIKISRAAVFDPQYAVIVSPQLHKKPNTGVAGETSEYINFLTLVKRWLALLTDFFSLFSFFVRVKKPPSGPAQGDSGVFRPPVIPVTLTIHWSVTFFFRKGLEGRGNTSIQVIARVRDEKCRPFFSSPALGLFKVLLRRWGLAGGGGGRG